MTPLFLIKIVSPNVGGAHALPFMLDITPLTGTHVLILLIKSITKIPYKNYFHRNLAFPQINLNIFFEKKIAQEFCSFNIVTINKCSPHQSSLHIVFYDDQYPFSFHR